MFKSVRIVSRPTKSASSVVPVFQDELKLPAKTPGVNKTARNQIAKSMKSFGFKGELGLVHFAPSGDLVMGLGKRDELTPDVLRIAGTRLIKQLDRLTFSSANLFIAEAISTKTIDAYTVGRCVAEGIGLANWRVDFLSGAASNQSKPKAAITFCSSVEHFRKGFQFGIRLADHVNYARRIAATPPNICNPTWMTKEARNLSRSSGLRTRIVDYAQAKRLGMGGIVNVGKGAKNKPCLILLEHKPKRIARSARGVTLALVGKTITYDTGGYSLKINNTMKGMKYDKCGGMAVLGAMRAIADLKLPVHVVGILPTAENMVSEDAYRPDDIISMYNDVSVEVTNTDAEGRLVLADALTYACKNVKATAVVDIATLTGGIVIALGPFCSGVFCNDEKLLDRVQCAADSSGEKTWRMPLWKDHMEFMRSPHADILNSNALRSAHAIQGAAFLAYFVDEEVPWAHIDMAGVMNVEKDTDFYVTGPTGYGVRLLVELAQSYTH